MVSHGVSILTREDPAPLRSRAIRRLVKSSSLGGAPVQGHLA